MSASNPTLGSQAQNQGEGTPEASSQAQFGGDPMRNPPGIFSSELWLQ